MAKSLWRGLIWMFVLLGAACSAPPPEMPPNPPELEVAAEYPFGDATSRKDTAAWTEVWDRLDAAYDANLRLERRVMNAHADWKQLQRYYQQALRSQGGWTENSSLTTPLPEGAWSFAMSHGDYVLALVGLEPIHAEGGQVPVSIITNLPE